MELHVITSRGSVLVAQVVDGKLVIPSHAGTESLPQPAPQPPTPA
jgi:hypothetical protein